jgi:hypothetical protein
VSMRKKKKKRKKVRMMHDLFGTEFLLFPFWYLDAKAGGGENLSTYVIYHFYSDLTCKTMIMYGLVVWTWFLKHLWCVLVRIL